MVSDQAVVGFNPNRLAEVLQLEVKVAPRDPSETIFLLGRVLEAVERVVRQMPNDKLGWAVPGRERPMNEFAYHVFSQVGNIIEEMATGAAPSSSDPIGRSYTSFQDIADYGRTVVERYRDWASQQDLEALRRAPLAGPSATGKAERLDHITAHTAHHLRQLYSVLEDFSITPEKRLQDSELPPEYVLTILW